MIATANTPLIQRLKKPRNDTGFITIWLLCLVVLLLFLGGISLDLWHGFSERRQLAAIADAAAVAGASQIDMNAFKKGTLVLDNAGAIARATTYLQQESQRSGVTLAESHVTVNPAGQVVVEVHEVVHASLSRILLPENSYNVVVRSVAEPMKAGAGG